MTEQIVSRATIRARGAAAFNVGRPRDSHNMNPGAAAIFEWHAGFDQAAQAWHAAQQTVRYECFTRRQAAAPLAEVPPP